MRQEFHGSVDQVAGRDIINQVDDAGWWSRSTPELVAALERTRAKLWRVRCELILNVPLAWLLLSALALVWMLLHGVWFSLPPLAMLGYLAVAELLPMFWLARIMDRRGKMVRFYKIQINNIDTVLQARHDAL